MGTNERRINSLWEFAASGVAAQHAVDKIIKTTRKGGELKKYFLIDEIHVRVLIKDDLTRNERTILMRNIDNLIEGLKAEKVVEDAITIDLSKLTSKKIKVIITR
jgi:hypothetical protein